MSYPYQDIARFVALRANQLGGGDAAEREARYSQVDVTAGMDGIEILPSSLKQDILAQGAVVASMIGRCSNPAFRRTIQLVSLDLSSGDPLPITGIGQVPFVGEFDGVFDSVDDRPLSKQPKQVVMRRVDNPNDFFVLETYHYYIEGSLIIHTRPTDVYMRGCGWDADAQAALYDAQGDCPLPAELATLHGALVLANCPQEDWFVADANYWGSMAEKEIMKFLPELADRPADSGRGRAER